MKNRLPFFPRLAVRIGYTILWACLRFIEVLFGVFAKWLKKKINKPF